MIVHAIEVSSRCNLRCLPYCPHPKALTRPKIDMSEEFFERALAWVDYCHAQNPIAELNLSGVGEPLMNQRVVEYVADVRRRYGDSVQITLPTNGLLLDDDMGARLEPYRPAVFVSLHKPVIAARAVQVATKYGLFRGANADPVLFPNDVAGQVDWYKSKLSYSCPWVGLQRTFVASDGGIYACCFNLTGESPLGHVSEEPRDLAVKPWRACPQCHQVLP